MLDIAGEHNLPVISDEIYDQLTYEKPFVSAANVTKDVPVIGLNGFSKVYQMTGWRLGYMYFKGQGEQSQRRSKMASRKNAESESAPTHPVQIAATAALNGPQDFVKDIVETLKTTPRLQLQTPKRNRRHIHHQTRRRILHLPQNRGHRQTLERRHGIRRFTCSKKQAS